MDDNNIGNVPFSGSGSVVSYKVCRWINFCNIEVEIFETLSKAMEEANYVRKRD